MEQARNPHRKRQRRTRDPVAAAVSSKDSNKGGCNDSDEDDDDLQKILELEAAMGPVICEECGIRLKLRQAKYFMDMQIYLLHSNTIVTAIAFDDIVADLTGGDAEQFDKIRSTYPELSSSLTNFAEQCVKNLHVRIDFRESIAASNSSGGTIKLPDPSKKQYDKDRVVSQILILDENFQPVLDRVVALYTS